jgi:hypothetical protein
LKSVFPLLISKPPPSQKNRVLATTVLAAIAVPWAWSWVE